MANSTLPFFTISTALSATTSFIVTLMSGYALVNCDKCCDKCVLANEGIAAKFKLPRLSVNNSSNSIKALSKSSINLLATGKNCLPSGVRERARVVLVNSLPPTKLSKFFIVMLRAG